MKSNTGPNAEGIVSLAGLLPHELSARLDLSPSYRGEQIFRALWKGAEEIGDVTTLSKELREELSKEAVFFSSRPEEFQREPGGTAKLTLRLEDGYVIECVLLTDETGRKTACLSTQAGCGMGCTYCRTGRLGFSRDLTAAEIVESESAVGWLRRIGHCGFCVSRPRCL